MKATGIVRRIDDLGRVVIPKEIRRTMRIREGDPLEIYTSRDGEVIFKKYSLLGGVEDFASHLCETMSRSTRQHLRRDRPRHHYCRGRWRPSVSSPASGFLRSWSRSWRAAESISLPERDQALPVSDSTDKLAATVAAPILAEGDLLGLVLFISPVPAAATGDAEYKLAQTIAAFLGRHMES